MDQANGEARNMRVLAQHDLGGFGLGGEGLGLQVKNGRRVLYVAHERAPKNFTVVDVSDPRQLKVIAQVDLPHDQVRSNSLSLAGDLLAVAYQCSRWGQTPAGMELFDVSDPANPRSVSFFDTSGPRSRGAHYVWFVDGEYAYLSTGMPDSTPTNPKDDQFPVIVDVRDPSHPREVGRWWLPGTQQGDDAPPPERHSRWDAGFRAHNVNVYPSHPHRCYVGYLDAGVVILDISNMAHPTLVSRLDYHPPMSGFTHTVLPLFSHNLLAVSDEAVANRGEDMPKLLWFVDASDERHLLIVSTAPLPPWEEHSRRDGRFGAHNIHENIPAQGTWVSEDVVFGAFFNGGVRAYDVRNRFQPREVGYCVPPGPPQSSVSTIQMNDLYVDDRGIIYALDRLGGGLYTIEYTR